MVTPKGQTNATSILKPGGFRAGSLLSDASGMRMQDLTTQTSKDDNARSLLGMVGRRYVIILEALGPCQFLSFKNSLSRLSLTFSSEAGSKSIGSNMAYSNVNQESGVQAPAVPNSTAHDFQPGQPKSKYTLHMIHDQLPVYSLAFKPPQADRP